MRESMLAVVQSKVKPLVELLPLVAERPLILLSSPFSPTQR